MITLRWVPSHTGIVVAVVLALLVSNASADCPDANVDIDIVKGLLAATDVASLDAQYAKCDARDPAIDAVYRKRRLALEPTKEEEQRYLRSLPKTGAALSRIYELTSTRDICEDPLIIDVVYNMFDTAAALVKKHGSDHGRFIQLCDLTDGEMGEVAWPAFDWLLKNDTARTVAALRSLPKAERTRICHGNDPKTLSARKAAKRCRSEL